jgi:hypothetical protein
VPFIRSIILQRYFFDIRGRGTPQIDYSGRLFSTTREAQDAAELLALDLSVTGGEEMIGSTVTVSNPEGRKIFSIPVQAYYLTAAPSVV